MVCTPAMAQNDLPTDFFNAVHYDEMGINLPPAYVAAVQDNWPQIQQIVDLNTYSNPLFLNIYVAAFYQIFSNATINQYSDQPLSPIHIPVLGLLASEKINVQSYWETLMNGTETEQHYKLWRYFFSTTIYMKNLNAIEGLDTFLMAFIDYAFYWDNGFERDVLLFYLFNFMNTGLTYTFDFSKICDTVRDNIETYFGSFMECLVAFEKLKLGLLTCPASNACHPLERGDPTSDCIAMDSPFPLSPSASIASQGNDNVALPLAAFLKIDTSKWYTFTGLINNSDYEKASQLCFA